MLKKKKSFTFNRPNGNRFVKKKLYDDVDWATFRFRFLKTNPICYCCGSPSKVIDHLVVHRGNKELFWKMDNLIPMCKTCHAVVTNKFDREGEQDLVAKLEWIKDRRISSGINISVKVIDKKGTH